MTGNSVLDGVLFASLVWGFLFGVMSYFAEQRVQAIVYVLNTLTKAAKENDANLQKALEFACTERDAWKARAEFAEKVSGVKRVAGDA